eukprot:8079507-Pyramimonas_sp.AAC.1
MRFCEGPAVSQMSQGAPPPDVAPSGRTVSHGFLPRNPCGSAWDCHVLGGTLGPCVFLWAPLNYVMFYAGS